MRVEQIGYGAGTRNSKDFPYVVRFSIGEAADDAPRPSPSNDADLVTVLETALDDLSPQVIAHVTETALARGALDVMLTPVIMKKGRPGTLLTVLCNPSESEAMERLILTETSTRSASRIRQDRRSCTSTAPSPRSPHPYGDIRIKVDPAGGGALNAAPDEDATRLRNIKSP